MFVVIILMTRVQGGYDNMTTRPKIIAELAVTALARKSAGVLCAPSSSRTLI